MENKYTIADEHVRLLRKKGYSEGKHFLGAKGRLEGLLNRAFAHALEKQRWTKEDEKFKVDAAVLIDGDLIAFRFFYEIGYGAYQPELKSLTARLEDIRREVVFSAPDELLSVQEIYELLVSARKEKIDRFEQEQYRGIKR